MILIQRLGCRPHRKIYLLASGIFSLCLLLSAYGQDLTLTFTVPPEQTAAGGSASLWLNALSSSTNEVSWTFPPTIESRIVSSQGIFGSSLTLHSAETGAVVILPGAFVRREYLLPMPKAVAGQAVIEFTNLNANRVVLNVAPAPPEPGLTNRMKGSMFSRLITDIEPEGPDESFHPGQFFKDHISGYEPLYFIAGTKSPTAKFQISFKYQLLNRDGPLAVRVPALKGFHIAYTQTSLWNLNSSDPSFYDTSYKPEFLYLWNRALGGKPGGRYQLDLQTGVQHESNGTGGALERSLNIVYLRPTLTLGRNDGLQLTIQPRAWLYVGGLAHNPDMPDYRGYVDLRTILGWKRGLQLSALGRMGRDGGHESLQLDLTYPTIKFFGSFSLYLDVQYFTGYGETLRGYNQKSEALRVGLSLFR